MYLLIVNSVTAKVVRLIDFLPGKHFLFVLSHCEWCPYVSSETTVVKLPVFILYILCTFSYALLCLLFTASLLKLRLTRFTLWRWRWILHLLLNLQQKLKNVRCIGAHCRSSKFFAITLQVHHRREHSHTLTIPHNSGATHSHVNLAKLFTLHTNRGDKEMLPWQGVYSATNSSRDHQRLWQFLLIKQWLMGLHAINSHLVTHTQLCVNLKTRVTYKAIVLSIQQTHLAESTKVLFGMKCTNIKSRVIVYVDVLIWAKMLLNRFTLHGHYT